MKKLFFSFMKWLRHFLTGSFYNRRNIWQAFPAFFDAAAEQTYQVPGLKKANTLNLKNEPVDCPSMTPQGLFTSARMASNCQLILVSSELCCICCR